jgi:NADPH:quinone reductase-like Zn-dependent oxidoreductase
MRHARRPTESPESAHANPQMKAVVYTRYGPPEVLQIRDVAKPVPAATEILIQVYAATVNRTDCGYRSAKYFVSRFFTGLVKPKRTVTGSEFAGKVVGIGADVTDFKVGDRVFGFDDLRGAAHAEYMTEAAGGPITTMPSGGSYEQVAPAAEGATYAINVIRAVRIRRGQRALVYGASGAIGSAAVQILKHLGVHMQEVACSARDLLLHRAWSGFPKSAIGDLVCNNEVPTSHLSDPQDRQGED